MSTVRIEVPTSAIDAATRDRIAELTRERDEARQNISGLEQQLNESCSQLARARERADDCRDQLDEIRRELGAGPGVTALEAVKQAQKEAARVEGDEWARANVLDDIRAALGTDARGPGLVGAVRGVVAALASAREARAELARYVAAVDAAIKHAAKVLP